MPELNPDVLAYYEQGNEIRRLTSDQHPSGPLELVRTQELISRFLPAGALQILDVGGGPGHYGEWLQEQGHDVHVVDPVPLHIEQAAGRGLPASLGDARALEQPTESVDAVLLLGPLYHLIDRDERVQALAEARRVVRPGGVVFAAAIACGAPLFDLVVRLEKFDNPLVVDMVTRGLHTGVLNGHTERLFTTAFLHRPHELREEAGEAGLADLRLFNVEGPGFIVADFAARWADPARREALLRAARLVEEDPDFMAAAGHLLLVGRRPFR